MNLSNLKRSEIDRRIQAEGQDLLGPPGQQGPQGRGPKLGESYICACTLSNCQVIEGSRKNARSDGTFRLIPL